MARIPRWVPPNSLVEISCRCIQGRFLLRPSKALNAIFVGVALARRNITPLAGRIKSSIARTASADLEGMLQETLEPIHHHHAVISGIQIHGPADRHYTWPGECYAVVRGERYELASSLAAVTAKA